MGKKLLFLILVLLLPLAACGKKEESPASTPTPEAGEEQVTISFAVFDWEQASYEDTVQAFEDANPNVQVRLVSINKLLELDLLDGDWPDDAWQRLASRADVINLNADRDAVEQGLIRDLSALIQADPNFQQDDFYPGALRSSQWDGGTWSLPTELLFDLILYDKDAFDEAGIAYPEPGWTWDDFLAKAKALTVRDGDRITQWGFVQPWSNHLPFIEGRVGALIDETSEPPEPRFDQSEVIEAVRGYADLYLKEEVVPYFEPPDEDQGLFEFEGQALVENGQAAMWREFSSNWAFRRVQGNRGVAPYPVNAPGSQSALGTTPMQTEGVCMSAGTAHPEVAWRWMDFVGRQESARLGPFIEFLPARRSVAQSSGFWDKVDEELGGALRYAIDHSYTPRNTTGYDPFFDALDAILSGEESVYDALIEAQAQAEADIQEAQTRQEEATPVPSFSVIQPEEEELAGETSVTIAFSPGVGAFNSIQAYRDAAREFQELHPDIQVEVKMPDFGDTIGVKGMAENADCFQWSPEIQDPASRALILNLKPFLDADPSFTTDDFYPALLEQFTWQGQPWALPAELQPYVIEYNKDLFDAAGVDYPGLDGSAELKVWTTDDLLELAVALTQGEGEEKQYGFVPEVFELSDMVLLIERRGARLIDESADPPAYILDDPATVEALRWYAGLSTEYEVKPIFMTDMTDMTEAAAFFLEREGLISDGRAAMWTSLGPLAMLSFGDNRGEMNTGVAPLPTGAGVASGGGSTTGYYISAQTEARLACWQWITFLTEQPDLTLGLPARRSVAESSAYRQRVGAERAATYQASVAGAEQSSVFDTFAGESWLAGGIVWLGRAYDRVVDGETSVEEALKAVQRLADDYRACVIARDAFSDQEEWQSCMQEVDPTLPDFLFNQSE